MNGSMDKTKKVWDNKSLKELQNILNDKGFQCIVLNSEKAVKDFISNRIPDECAVGLGDSITTCRLKLRNILNSKGSTIFYSWDGSENYNRSLDTFEIKRTPAYYLTRINALTIGGEILMKDYSRKAASEHKFPANIYAFAGLNRVVEEFNSEESVIKYTVIDHCPANTNFIIALLPFLDY